MTATAIHIPTLRTERLILRAPRAADMAVFVPLLQSDRARYMSGPHNAQSAWQSVAADTGSWVLSGYGYWTVVLAETGEVAGFAGLGQPPAYAELELGWAVTAAAEGRGIAFEAAGAARDWGFATLGLDTLVSYIDGANARSIALAERLGAVRDDGAARPDPEDVVYRHPKPELAP